MQFIRESDPQLGPHADLFRKHVSAMVHVRVCVCYIWEVENHANKIQESQNTAALQTSWSFVLNKKILINPAHALSGLDPHQNSSGAAWASRASAMNPSAENTDTAPPGV